MALPQSPNNLSPWGGQVVVVSIENTFSWQSDGSQAAYFIEWIRNAPGEVASNTGWITSSLEQYAFGAGTFINTYEYRWRVKVRNNAGQESVFSDWAVFRAGNPAELTIVFPEHDMDALSAVPVYQHVYNSPNGYYQVAYQYKLFTGTTWDDFDALTAAEQESYTWDELEALATGTLLWDSGRVESTATSVEQPSDKLQILQYWYKVQATIWDNVGNQVVSAIRTFGLLVDSVPKIPKIVSATPDASNGQNIILISNPPPDVGQIGVDYNKLYRRKLDGSWELVMDNIADESGLDKTCRSAKQEEYAVSAVGTNGIESSKSESAFATCTLTDYWFTNLATNETMKFRLDTRWGLMQSERERAEWESLDEAYPSIAYGAMRFYRGSFQAAVELPDGLTWPTYVAQMESVLDAGDEVLYRSLFGDLYRFDVSDFEFEAPDRFDQYRTIRFNLTEVLEEVAPGTYTYDEPPSPLDGFWVIDPDTNRGMKLMLGPAWGGMKRERSRFEGIGLNSEMPRVGRGKKKTYRGGFSGYLMASDTESCAERVARFRELVDGKIKKPLLFKTINGDVYLMDTYGFSYELFDRFNNARKVSFEMVEVGIVSEPAPQTGGIYFLSPNFPALFEEEVE